MTTRQTSPLLGPAAIEAYRRDGYYIHRGFFDRRTAEAAGAAGDTVLVRGSLDRVRDLVAVDDAARAIVDCALDPATRGRVLNVGTGVG
jgi:nucleoside-diphosphate-sugar epimerase